MAVFFSDDKDYIKCSCGCMILTEENHYTFKVEKNRKDEIVRKELIDIKLRCTNCKKILDYKLDKNKILSF